ncbi:uncharacterized protein LOC115013117 [Cottoperca gobio]|uniref:Uncharacterized protein LOC115013117 n=1 Tax=Cottoperca gobio TaxID=56716 RepID=A0A6J2QBD8_COTGO|nr:uncharacterized protein LOC115013117 [Cottoperca gobio]
MQTASAATQQNSPSHFFFLLRIPHWTKAASCHANGRHSAPPSHPPQPRRTCDTSTDTDMLQHPSHWTKRRVPRTKRSEAEHIGSVRVEEVDLLLEDRRQLLYDTKDHHVNFRTLQRAIDPNHTDNARLGKTPDFHPIVPLAKDQTEGKSPSNKRDIMGSAPLKPYSDALQYSSHVGRHLTGTQCRKDQNCCSFAPSPRRRRDENK